MRNYDVYLERMEKSMQDKLFFLNHIDINSYDYVIDYGCANGELLSRINIPDNKKIGIEKSEEMRKRFKEKLPNALLFSNIFDFWKDYVKLQEEKRILLILSSVLHEMSNTEQVFCVLGVSIPFVNTIVIRDMVEPEIKKLPNIRAITKVIVKNCNAKIVRKWELERGKIKTIKDLSEFLLKMDYVENYDLEVKEHYFSGNVEMYQKILCEYHSLRFKAIYEEDFTIPPMIEKQDKYGLPHFRTHRKLIMERVEKE